MGRISGPLLDRFDLRIEVPSVSFNDLDLPATGETSSQIATRVQTARERQTERYTEHPGLRVNADAEGALLEEFATPDSEGRALIRQAAERVNLSARGYHRVLKVARTIADLDGASQVARPHVAEALSYRIPASVA